MSSGMCLPVNSLFVLVFADTRSSVVFSNWRFTLDIVEYGLKQNNITSIRFDGKVLQKDRRNVVDNFKTQPDIRVMLLTLSCGAVG